MTLPDMAGRPWSRPDLETGHSAQTASRVRLSSYQFAGGDQRPQSRQHLSRLAGRDFFNLGTLSLARRGPVAWQNAACGKILGAALSKRTPGTLPPEEKCFP